MDDKLRKGAEEYIALCDQIPYQFAVCDSVSADYAIIVRPEDPGRD
jgi:hypothetical protein